jgi:hypothetical protein
VEVRVCFMSHRRSGQSLHKGAKTGVISAGRGVGLFMGDTRSGPCLSTTINNMNIIDMQIQQ